MLHMIGYVMKGFNFPETAVAIASPQVHIAACAMVL